MTDPSVSLDVARLRALIKKWREKADAARVLAAKFDAEHDESGNSFAFLKETRVRREQADDLENLLAAALPAADPQPAPPSVLRYVCHLEKCSANPDVYPWRWRESDRPRCDCGLAEAMSAADPQPEKDAK